MLSIAKIDRYDNLNNPGDTKAALTLWFSGCSVQCNGCHNSGLWDKSAGQEYTVDGILFTICTVFQKYDMDTVVLLGGEPMEQDTNEIKRLVNRLSMYGYKVWLYTSTEFEDIPDDIKKDLYTIKCGKYDEALDQTPKFPSSSNQRIFRKTDEEWKQINL